MRIEMEDDQPLFYKEYKEQLKQDKINHAIRLLASSTGACVDTVRQAVQRMSEVGLVAAEAAKELRIAISKIGIVKKPNLIQQLIEQKRVEEKAQQQANKAYYNRLLLKLSTEYFFSIVECLNVVKSFHRRCDMQLKTFSNLRF